MKKDCLIQKLVLLVLLVFIFNHHNFSQKNCEQNRDEWRHLNIHSGVSFEFETARLDVVANYLKLCPEKVVYLVGLNSVKKKKSTILLRLRKSKKYLITTHKISSKRIITFYGGTSSEIVMNIFFDDLKSQKKPN